jgi:MYXO-CTERM domain-containing protein
MTFARHGFASAVLGATMLCAGTAHAHFVLQAPAANLEQGPLGDPQKVNPCGQDGSGVETGMVTAFQAGETITITIDETVPHPGHYRVALAINDPSELPDEPAVTEGDSDCGSAAIMDPPVFPVLADGIFAHTSAFSEPQSIEIQLPDDVECDACTLQVLEFMAEHPASCFYHHCATISIHGATAEGSSSVSGAESESSGADDDSSDGGSMTTDPTATTNDSTVSAGESEGSDTDVTATAGSATAATTAGVTDSVSSGDDGDDDSGCGCTTDSSSPLAGMLALLGLVALRRRR